MYHHHSQPQGPPQPSSNRPGPTHHQQQPNQQQHQDRFKYPPPSHLPDELVSAMATRGSGDMDHCLMDLVNRPNPNQMSRSGGYSSNQLGHQQGMDWSDYPHSSRLFASPLSTVTQQPQSSALGNQQDRQDLYTPERAESILASLGLSDEPSQYPEDQLNPDILPFIPRSIQTNKSKSQNIAASSSYSQSASRSIHDILPPPARSLSSTGRLGSPEVPRFLSVPQTAGNGIDYGHASQATDDSSGRESMPERRHAHLQHFEPNVDLDYCRSSSEVHENRRLSPAREFPPLYRSGHPDQEYSRDGPRPSPSSETWNDSSSRHPVLRSHDGTTRSARAKAREAKRIQAKAKKLKVSTQRTPGPSNPACLVYLTGIPTATTEQEVETWVSDFGKYNNVVLFPGSDADPGQKASVCMEKEEDALALAQCSSLSIRDQPITATLAKKPEADDSTAVSKVTSSQEKSAIGGEDDARTHANRPERDNKKTSEEEFSPKSTVLISGLPAESGGTESDVIRLCQLFAAPADIILARQLGKALLLIPDEEMAKELVKNLSVAPMKINDSEVKMINLEQDITLNTPVALYNLLNQSKDTLKVCWNRLMVIRNVPDTPTASSEVQMLVRRIAKIHNTLVLNHNMIICEMLNAGAVVRIRSHYHRFPCMVQGNPLFFTSRPDPTTPSQVWGPRWLPPWPTASLDSFKESPDDDRDSTLQEDGKCVYLEELCYAGAVIGFHCKLCDVRIETTDALSLDSIHIDTHVNENGHKWLSKRNEEYIEEVDKNNLQRFYCALCKCYMDGLKSKTAHMKTGKHVASLTRTLLENRRARKVKWEAKKLREQAGEESSEDEDASKEQQNKEQQDIEAGEELSIAAPTQVCDPEEDVKTDKIIVSIAKHREGSKANNTSPEGLNKMNSGPKETESSGCAADGEVSSSKPVHLDLPRESPDDDKDNPTVPTAGQDDSTLQEDGKCVYPEEPCYDDGYVEELNQNKNLRPFYCNLCMCYIKDLERKIIHMKCRKHLTALQEQTDKLKQGEGRDHAHHQDEEQDVKVGEQLSNAAPTQVCGPQAEEPDKMNSADDKDRPTTPTADERLYCELCNCVFTKQHLQGRMHAISLQLLEGKGEADGCFQEVRNSKGRLIRLHCKLCECNVQLTNKEHHLDTKTHKRIVELHCDFDKAKELKELVEDSAPRHSGRYDYLVDVCYDGTPIGFFCALCESTLNSIDVVDADAHVNGVRHNKLRGLDLYLGKKQEDRSIQIFSQTECVVEVNLIMTLHKQFCCVLCKCYIRNLSDKYIHLRGKKHIGSLWKKMNEGSHIEDVPDPQTLRYRRRSSATLTLTE